MIGGFSPAPASGPGGSGPRWALFIVLIGWAGIAWYGVANSCGPAPHLDPAAAAGPDARFSAGRALAIVDRMVGDGEPHPAGSPQNDVVRERLVAEIRALGFDPEVHETSSLRAWRGTPVSVPLENVLFRLEADAPADEARTLLLMAHYDSVPTGPGTGDDAAGVAAVVEVARMLQTLSGRRHHVLFLITDGEEYGLLGAGRFLEEHPDAGQVDMCLNLEGRGNRGPSLMFQTGPVNRGPVRLLARTVSRPMTSSLYELVYRQMPNGTDFTHFIRRGIPGFNFAFIGNPRAYHTREDSVENLDLRSLQHHGDNAWQLARALVTEREWPEREGAAVWFDVLGRWVVWWPVAWTLPAAVAILLSALAVSTGRQRNAARLWSCLYWLAMLGLIAMVGSLILWGVFWLAQRDDALVAFWPSGRAAGFLLTGLWAGALALMAAGVRLTAAWEPVLAGGGIEGQASTAVLTGASLLGLLLAGFVPEASWLVLVPAAAGAVAAVVIALAGRRSSGGGGVWAAVPLPLAAGVLALPLVPSLFDALGFAFPWMWPVIALFLGLTLAGVLERQERRDLDRLACLAMGGALILVIAAVFLARAG